MFTIRRSRGRKRGQSLIEYAILIGTIVVILVVAVGTLGPNVSNLVTDTVGQVAGITGDSNGGGAEPTAAPSAEPTATPPAGPIITAAAGTRGDPAMGMSYPTVEIAYDSNNAISEFYAWEFPYSGSYYGPSGTAWIRCSFLGGADHFAWTLTTDTENFSGSQSVVGICEVASPTAEPTAAPTAAPGTEPTVALTLGSISRPNDPTDPMAGNTLVPSITVSFDSNNTTPGVDPDPNDNTVPNNGATWYFSHPSGSIYETYEYSGALGLACDEVIAIENQVTWTVWSGAGLFSGSLDFAGICPSNQ